MSRSASAEVATAEQLPWAGGNAEPITSVWRYLRRRDKICGYLPVLAMRDGAAEDWARLWTDVRRLDDWTEGPGHADAGPVEIGQEVRARHPHLARELHDLARWPAVEEALYGGGRIGSVEDYFTLMYYRAFLPMYIAAALAFPGESASSLATWAMYAGYGVQIVDDTLDLADDLERGRIFVTQEELDHLGLAPEDLRRPDALTRAVRFRNRWALHYYGRGHRVTSLFSPENRRLSRSWLEFGTRALADGKITPLPRNVVQNHRRYFAHFGTYMAFIDLPLPERWRMRLLRPFARRLVATTSIVDVAAVAAQAERGGPALPSVFRVERIVGREVELLPLPEAEAVDERREVTFVHYGARGVFPTLRDFARILLGR